MGKSTSSPCSCVGVSTRGGAPHIARDASSASSATRVDVLGATIAVLSEAAAGPLPSDASSAAGGGGGRGGGGYERGDDFHTTLPNSARQMPCNQTPLLRTVLSDELDDLQVLFSGPRTFHQARLKYLLPSVEALNLSSISQFLGNLLPVASTVLLDSRTERIVLWGFLFGFEVDFLGRERRYGWGEMEWKGVDWREE